QLQCLGRCGSRCLIGCWPSGVFPHPQHLFGEEPSLTMAFVYSLLDAEVGLWCICFQHHLPVLFCTVGILCIWGSCCPFLLIYI
ncbi:hypothetical protein LINPERPRIM_LOCUS35545, partial [Linum perenne]